MKDRDNPYANPSLREYLHEIRQDDGIVYWLKTTKS